MMMLTSLASLCMLAEKFFAMSGVTESFRTAGTSH